MNTSHAVLSRVYLFNKLFDCLHLYPFRSGEPEMGLFVSLSQLFKPLDATLSPRRSNPSEAVLRILEKPSSLPWKFRIALVSAIGGAGRMERNYLFLISTGQPSCVVFFGKKGEAILQCIASPFFN